MIFYREKESKKSDKHSETNIGKRKTGKGTVKKNEQFKFFWAKEKKPPTVIINDLQASFQ